MVVSPVPGRAVDDDESIGVVGAGAKGGVLGAPDPIVVGRVPASATASICSSRASPERAGLNLKVVQPLWET